MIRRALNAEELLVAVLERYGVEIESFWEAPLEAMERLTMLRMMEMLAKPGMKDETRIRAIQTAYAVHPLGQFNEFRRQSANTERFRSRYKQVGEKVIDVGGVKDE